MRHGSAGKQRGRRGFDGRQQRQISGAGKADQFILAITLAPACNSLS
jgi:hypothetical protein